MRDFLIELPPKGFLLKKRIQERDLRLCWGPFIGFLFRDVPTFLQGNFPQNIHFGNLSLAAAAEQNPFGTRVVLRLQSFTAPYLRMSSVHIATQSINHLDVAQLMENVAWGWLVQGSIGCQASKRSPSTRSSLQQLYMALNWDGRAKNMDGYSNRFIPPSKNAEINCSMFFFVICLVDIWKVLQLLGRPVLNSGSYFQNLADIKGLTIFIFANICH